MPAAYNITGKQFGKWTAVRRSKPYKGFWVCHCECGTKRAVRIGNLINGQSTSCGCQRKYAFTNATHCRSYTTTYQSWCAMKQRCCNPRSEAFKNYGARGITVCKRWLNSFENFFQDMGECPAGLTIERKDNNENYTPENCVWASRRQQQRNRRNSRLIEIGGVTKTLAEWAEMYNLRQNVITYRLNRGYSTIEAVMLPVFARYKRSPAPPSIHSVK